MSRRIEIELTSARADGTWTWRAAGAREPKGVLDGGILPGESKAGDVLKVEADFEIDGISVLSVVPGREKVEKTVLLELKPQERPFEPVTQQLAPKSGRDRRPPRDGDRRPPRDGDRRPPRDGGDRRERRPPREGGPAERGEGAGRAERGPRRESTPGAPRGGGERGGGERGGAERRERRPRPSFTPPPELPQRPKAKRLKPGRAHRNEVLAQLPEEQRPIAELTLQGMQAVRQRVRDDNERLVAEGKPAMPEASVLKMAEELMPKLRVAEWLDRADAAKRDLAELDLRDLRSVVATSDDPMVARDESTRAIAAELRQGLTTKQEHEYRNWLEDIDAALGVGRIVRALKLSGQPPKAGALFPTEVAHRLVEAANASFTPDAPAERWITVLEAAAFSPVHAHVTATAPATVPDDLAATVRRLGALLPQVAVAFGVEVAKGPTPKPLRPQRPAPKKQPGAAPSGKAGAASPKPIPAPPTSEPPAPAAAAEAPAETPVAETPVDEVPVAEAPVDEAPAETSADEAPAAEAPDAE